MIVVSNDTSKVVVTVGLSIGYSIELDYPRHCTMDAVLLRNQIQNDLNNKIERIRREAYELGWKEAKSKKARKKDWFNGNINSDFI